MGNSQLFWEEQSEIAKDRNASLHQSEMRYTYKTYRSFEKALETGSFMTFWMYAQALKNVSSWIVQLLNNAILTNDFTEFEAITNDKQPEITN